jgi:hypothetical protein
MIRPGSSLRSISAPIGRVVQLTAFLFINSGKYLLVNRGILTRRLAQPDDSGKRGYRAVPSQRERPAARVSIPTAVVVRWASHDLARLRPAVGRSIGPDRGLSEHTYYNGNFKPLD